MEVLITGANSSLAQSFLEVLSKNKKIKIFGTSRSGVQLPGFKKVFKLDLSKDPDLFIDRVFDLVIHIASLVPRNVCSAEEFYNVNVKNPLIFFQSLNFGQNSKFLNISSSSVYKKTQAIELFESSPITNEDQYGISKINFEREICDLLKNMTPVLTLRVPCLLTKNVQGNFISNWRTRILRNEKISISNPDSIFNAAIDGKSLIEFFLKFQGNSISLNVASIPDLTLLEMARHMSNCLGRELKYEIEEPRFPSQLILTSLAEKYGFKPPILTEIIDDYCKN